MNFSDEWKVLILQRWAGEFPPALRDEADIVLKSSQDIADDLSGAADEVSAFMAVNGYGIVFDAGYPKWIIKMNKQLIIEK